MFLLAFVSMGVFASASNGKLKAIKIPVKFASHVKPLLAQWKSSFTCGGKTYSVCCFETRSESHSAGLYLAYQVCP